MADVHGEEQGDRQRGGRTSAGRPQRGSEAATTPGLDAVKALRVTGDAAAARVVEIMRQHPGERDEILAWLHQHRGNAFVQQVTHRQGVIERGLPEGIEVKAVRASVVIPGRRKLAGDWSHAVHTKYATELCAEVTTTGVRVTLRPSLHVDATWPLRNAGIDAAGIDFTTGRAFADVHDLSGFGSGMISIRDKIVETLTGQLQRGIANSPLARPGYQPTQDPDLEGTLNAVIRNFTMMFEADGGDGGGGAAAAVSPRELRQLSAGGTVAMRAGGRFLQDGNGLVIPPGTELDVAVEGAGNVQDVLDTTTPSAALTAANIRAVRLQTSGLEVMAGDKPIARITAMHLARGGAVVIDHMELLGKARDARDTESGLSLLGALIALAARDPRAAHGLAENAQNPQLVDGVTKRLMERQFTEKVHDMILQYRTAVPGVDLAQLLGIA